MTFLHLFALYPVPEISFSAGGVRSEGLATRRLKGEDMILQREWVDEL